ncbi:division/outer membrane stress-associated lipid-binding lipoprotein [[Haemophilus] ducreyi]|uniref:division/outer membrane stress-associated lipid-binding lipoprotein n=1 Tax=Haemophilus ducreyi TaxID=730 RepID=UPI0006552D33|nr:division/outer membrane stress-associated lipid-binding lipoprotein [[Haemophilus] ducreyi]AKO45233.1 hemolysin [[Haemophilus] ducreyi]AKO46635.1 hemolysin [[Haemophilus] ducreyi]AKO47976.1 hemolysin [[Haemophilus] ducreyi]AKO49364.1 hemolysin [[Haemophilus] ducreyi]ANF61598.1 BON domain-containing protein [[Haemophilus] ducreyi]
MLTLVKKMSLAGLFTVTILSLQGCIATALISSAAVATKVATDPRSTGRQIDDEILEERVAFNLNKDAQLRQEARINVVSYNGKVLLIGQAPDADVIENAKNITAGVEDVSDVYNEIRRGKKIGLSQISVDSWITSTIKSKLLLESKVKSTDVKVITENGEVFLMGKLSQAQANAVANIARNVKGVKKVIKVISYVQ